MCLCTRDCGRGSRWRGGKGSSEKNVCTLNLWDGMNRTMVWRYEWSWQRKRCQLASVQLALSHLYTFHLPWWEPVQLKMKWKWNWGKEIGCRYWKFNHCPSAFNFVCYCFEFRKFSSRKIAVSWKSEGARLGIFQVNETSAWGGEAIHPPCYL